jgi:hypothetical protein
MWNNEDYHFDKRLIERNIDKGQISEDDYEQHLEGLEDASENAAVIEAEFEVDVLEEDDEQEESSDDETEESQS